MMNYFSSFLATVFCSFFITGASSQSLVKIDGQFTDVKSQPLLLAYYLGSKQYIKDTVQLDEKGKFSFAYPELLEQGIYLFVLPDQGNKYAEFLVTNDQQFSVKAKFFDFTKTAMFTGSEDNAFFMDYLKKIDGFRKKEEKWLAVKERHSINITGDSMKLAEEAIRQNDAAYKSYKKELFSKHPNTFLVKLLHYSERPEVPETGTNEEKYYYYKAHIFDNIDWSFDGILRSPSYEGLLTYYIDELTVQQPDSIIAACDFILQKTRVNDDIFKYTLIELVNKYARSTTICFDKIYVHLVDNYYVKGQAFWLNPANEEDKASLKRMEDNANRLKPVLCGSYAYNFNLADDKGAKHELRKIAGERTILVFWASDCHKCEAFMKELAKITDLCEKKGVAIVSVDNGTDTKLWKEKLQKYAVKNMLALTSSSSEELQTLIDQYDIYSTPTVFLLDKEKKILYKKLEVDQIKELVEGLPDQNRKDQ